MITSKELLAKGWKSHDAGFRKSWTHPKLRDIYGSSPYWEEKPLLKHSLAQARWAQEHILEKQK